MATKDHEALSQLCAVSLRVNGCLMDAILKQLPPEKIRSVDGLMEGGASVGIETLVNKAGRTRVLLVCVELEGARRVLAEVPPPRASGAK